MDDIAELALWTAGSIVLWVLGTHIAQWVRAAARQVCWAGFAPAGPAIRLAMLCSSSSAFIFYLLIPYLALLRHALSPVVIGLSGTDG